jgi:pyruvate,water dikinase
MAIAWLRRKLLKHPSPAGDDLAVFRDKYDSFQRLQESNAELLGIISDAEEKLKGTAVFGAGYLLQLATRTIFHAGRMVYNLDRLADGRYGQLKIVWERISDQINTLLSSTRRQLPSAWVLPFEQINRKMTDVVGGKSANLGEIFSVLWLPVPAGFAITTGAFETFLAHNHLTEEINQLKMELADDRPETLNRLSQRVHDLFLTADIPSDLAAAILKAFDDSIPTRPGRPVTVALRSSAVGEDSADLSFAGQYLSLLGIRREAVLDGYRRVLASLFSPRALAYRILKGIRADDIAMGVTCQEMIASKASGILFTRDPLDTQREAALINATWGLGSMVADGKTACDTYRLVAQPPHAIIERRIVSKKSQLKWDPDTGAIASASVPHALQDVACLNDERLQHLAAIGRTLEDHFGSAQDVEWTLDEAGRLIVLQSRPLTAMQHQCDDARSAPPVAGRRLLVQGGDVACEGVGTGPLHVVLSGDDLNRFPENGVLAASQSSPRLVMVMHKASAIITGAGSVTGHMASLAREFGVPTILNLPGAVSLAPAGTVVTVDANTGRVYEGRVDELLTNACRRPHRMIDTQMYKWLLDLTALIVPLHLTDPDSPQFKAGACRTVHDIMRLVHEVAYREMFAISDLATDHTRMSLRFNGALPMDLYIIDLGGGIAPAGNDSDRVKAEQVVSAPLRSLLAGLNCNALAGRKPGPVSIGGFFSVFSRQMLSPPTTHSERFGDKSYAIVSDKYLNFSSRVGYHFSILDVFCGPEAVKNYINFEFKGGAADDRRRNRRARLIQRILGTLGFWTQVTGDRIQARLGKHPAQRILEVLDQLGRLIIYTRQMDMLMADDASVDKLAECFLAGDYTLCGYAADASDPETA